MSETAWKTEQSKKQLADAKKEIDAILQKYHVTIEADDKEIAIKHAISKEKLDLLNIPF